MNQEYALARWREDGAKHDPTLYFISQRHGRLFIWLNVSGNLGWYAPEINKQGKMVGIRNEALPQPTPEESDIERKQFNWQFKLISPRQRKKIEELLASYIQNPHN